MAIDTADKRRSAAPQIQPFMLGPIPDGSIMGLDRRHLAALYRSIVAASGFVQEIEVIAQFSDQTAEVIAQFSDQTIEVRII